MEQFREWLYKQRLFLCRCHQEQKIWRLWRFRCQRLPAPALISPLIDYVPRWIALLCLVVCIARRCQIVSSLVPGGCCVALQMLMCASVLSWIKPGERFRSSLGSVVTGTMTVCMHSWGILPCINQTLNRLLRWLHSSVLYLLTPRLNAGWLLCIPDCDEIMTTWFCPVGIPLRYRHRIIQYK